MERFGRALTSCQTNIKTKEGLKREANQRNASRDFKSRDHTPLCNVFFVHAGLYEAMRMEQETTLHATHRQEGAVTSLLDFI